MRWLAGAIRSLFTTRAARRHARVGRPGLWKMKRGFQIHFLRQFGLEPEHYLLDIGCGTLRGGLPIIAYLHPGHYYGAELRADVLEEGRRELIESGLEEKTPVLIHVESLSSLQVPVSFDLIWAFSVLIHMCDDILDECLALVSRSLKHSGRFYANVKIGSDQQSTWRGFPVVSRRLAFYEEKAAGYGLRVTDIGSLESLGHRSGIAKQDRQRMLELRPT